MNDKFFFNWSSGKDSAMALHKIQNTHKIDLLITTVNQHFDRVSMHGTRRDLLLKQAQYLDIPIELIELPEHTDMATYDRLMKIKMQELLQRGYTNTVFGDIFLEDLRAYHEEKLTSVGIKAHFPLWGEDTNLLMKEFLDLGFRAVIVCADAKYFSKEFVGKQITEDLINALPKEVDSCGENGEFHTFCFDGPIFSSAVEYTLGDKIYREYNTPKNTSNSEAKIGFWYCDLLTKDL